MGILKGGATAPPPIPAAAKSPTPPRSIGSRIGLYEITSGGVASRYGVSYEAVLQGTDSHSTITDINLADFNISRREGAQLKLRADNLGHLTRAGIVKHRNGFFTAETGILSIVTEAVTGIELRATFGSRRPTKQEADEILIKILEILDPLHQSGVVHGDICPENILGETDGTIILDGFWAHVAQGKGRIKNMEFSAPEILRGIIATVQADLYSAGVLYLNLRTLKSATEANISGHRFSKSLTFRENLFLARALEMDPENRFASAEVMLNAFRRFIVNESTLLTYLDRIGERLIQFSETNFGKKVIPLAKRAYKFTADVGCAIIAKQFTRERARDIIEKRMFVYSSLSDDKQEDILRKADYEDHEKAALAKQIFESGHAPKGVAAHLARWLDPEKASETYAKAGRFNLMGKKEHMRALVARNFDSETALELLKKWRWYGPELIEALLDRVDMQSIDKKTLNKMALSNKDWSEKVEVKIATAIDNIDNDAKTGNNIVQIFKRKKPVKSKRAREIYAAKLQPKYAAEILKFDLVRSRYGEILLALKVPKKDRQELLDLVAEESLRFSAGHINESIPYVLNGRKKVNMGTKAESSFLLDYIQDAILESEGSPKDKENVAKRIGENNIYFLTPLLIRLYAERNPIVSRAAANSIIEIAKKRFGDKIDYQDSYEVKNGSELDSKTSDSVKYCANDFPEMDENGQIAAFQKLMGIMRTGNMA